MFSSGCVSDHTRDENTSSSHTSDSQHKRTENVITITDSPIFDPSSITVESGDIIQWRNNDHRIHTVTADENEIPDDADYFASGGYPRESLATVIYPFGGKIKPGERFAHKFKTPGTYKYYSIPAEHLGVIGEVVVQ
jgi:plastocyanin